MSVKDGRIFVICAATFLVALPVLSLASTGHALPHFVSEHVIPTPARGGMMGMPGGTGTDMDQMTASPEMQQMHNDCMATVES